MSFGLVQGHQQISVQGHWIRTRFFGELRRHHVSCQIDSWHKMTRQKFWRKERESVCGCASACACGERKKRGNEREREREWVSVCMWREKERRKRECVCVCVCAFVRVCVCPTVDILWHEIGHLWENIKCRFELFFQLMNLNPLLFILEDINWKQLQKTVFLTFLGQIRTSWGQGISFQILS